MKEKERRRQRPDEGPLSEAASPTRASNGEEPAPLPVSGGRVLADRYEIQETLAQGAFAVTHRMLEGLSRFEVDRPAQSAPERGRAAYATLGQRAAGGG